MGPPEYCWPPRDKTDRDLPRTNGVGVALAYGDYATVYRSECPQGPECPFPRESGLVTGLSVVIDIFRPARRTAQRARET